MKDKRNQTNLERFKDLLLRVQLLIWSWMTQTWPWYISKGFSVVSTMYRRTVQLISYGLNRSIPPAVSCSYPCITTRSPGLQSVGGHRGVTCRFPSELKTEKPSISPRVHKFYDPAYVCKVHKVPPSVKTLYCALFKSSSVTSMSLDVKGRSHQSTRVHSLTLGIVQFLWDSGGWW